MDSHWNSLSSPVTTVSSAADEQHDPPQAHLHAMRPPAHAHIESRKYTAEDWDIQRPEITRLYWTEDKTLELVMELMTEQHGLIATYLVAATLL